MALSRDQVVDTAVEILRRYGLADLSMRRLARELGVAPGALYWHVTSKQELLVEVADTSVLDDRLVKGRAYAEARIAIYWLVDLIARRVEVYTDPTGPDPEPAYRRREDYTAGQSIPLIIGGDVVQAVPVADLLPVPPARP